MSEGLVGSESAQPFAQALRPTLSRVASLSRMLDVFFAGILNQVCQEVSDEWKQSTKNRYSDKIDGIFYVMYSGGDDLFIVGPWDQTLLLAQRIHLKFHLFAAQNPGMTLSAGFVQVKPRYPVQKFAGLAEEAEKLAKKERNQLAVFGEALSWPDFDWLQNEAERWVKSIEAKDLPSGLIYDLGGLFRQHRDRNGNLRPTWTPQLYYTLARRLKPELRREFEQDIFKVIASGKTLVPVSIASLSIRERSE
jgi:CRISPR-associated protein Csm1